jgi:hypothetical protein
VLVLQYGDAQINAEKNCQPLCRPAGGDSEGPALSR